MGLRVLFTLRGREGVEFIFPFNSMCNSFILETIVQQEGGGGHLDFIPLFFLLYNVNAPKI